MNKPYMLLAAPELERLKREGIHTLKAAYYMRLENGGVLELMRPISEPVKLYGDDPRSESAHMRYIFENVSRPGLLTVLRRLDEHGNLEGSQTYKDDNGFWNVNYAFCRFGDRESSTLTAADAKNLREVIAFMGEEFMTRLERRYKNDPRDCFWCY